MAPARSRLGDVIVFAGISLFGVAFTAMLAVREYQEYKDAAVADGIVTKLNAGGAHPEIEFTTPDGQTVSYPQGGMIGGYEPGQHVRVLYLRDNPKLDPTLDVIGARYAFACFTGLMTAIGLVVATLPLFTRRRS
jgi:Protein of unknown function (DUF3592)